MNEQLTAISRSVLDAAHANTMDFPTCVRVLDEAGFEGYLIDFRREAATYYLPGGESVQHPLPKAHAGEGVGSAFHASVVERAVQEARDNAPGYTYEGFCAKVKAAGCAGYMVSFLGKRVVYFGRTAETHVETFPQ